MVFILLAVPAIARAQLRVAVEFGDPAARCVGRGKLCRVDAVSRADVATGEPVAWLSPTAAGGWELFFPEGSATRESLEFLLPAGYCDLPLPLVLPPEVSDAMRSPESGPHQLPAGRYRLIATRKGWYLRF